MVASPDDKVAEIAPSYGRLFSDTLIDKVDSLAIRHAKSPVCPCCRGGRVGRKFIPSGRHGCLYNATTRATGARVNRFFIFIMRRERSLHHVLARAFARINESTDTQFLPCLQIIATSLALNVRRKRPAHVRPFIPVEPEPVQILADRLREFFAWLRNARKTNLKARNPRNNPGPMHLSWIPGFQILL